MNRKNIVYRYFPPWSVIAIMALLVAIEGGAHLYMACCPPEGYVNSGMRIWDYAFWYPAMRMFESGFFNPYVAPSTPQGQYGAAYFALPYHWLFGLLGAVQRSVGVSEFAALGAATTGSLLLYLIAVWAFMRRLFPGQAPWAFMLFAAGLGTGGPLYLMLFAHTGTSAFHPFGWVHILTRYEFWEGPFLRPDLLMGRPYYTFPLALGFLGLAHLVPPPRTLASRRACIAGVLLIAAAGFINFRLGPLFVGAAALPLLCRRNGSARQRMALLAALFLTLTAQAALCYALLHIAPSLFAAHADSVSNAVWPSAFFMASAWAWPPLLYVTFSTAPRVCQPWRVLLGALLGYLTAYALGYAYHHAYHGALRPLDYGASIWVSDYALLGAPLGAALFSIVPRRIPGTRRAPWRAAWMLAWLYGLLALGISAWGGGWLLRFLPERTMVLMGVPLSIAAAWGLNAICRRRPLFGRTFFRLAVTSGIATVLICHFVVYRPLRIFAGELLPGVPGAVPTTCFASLQTEELIAALPTDAHTLAPMDSMADLVVIRGRGSVVLGIGTMDYGTENYNQVRSDARRFFSARVSPAERWDTAARYQATHVLLPDGLQALPDTLRQELDAVSWLEEVHRAGTGALYRVLPAPPL